MKEVEVVISVVVYCCGEINKNAIREPNVNVDSFASLFLVHINGNNYHQCGPRRKPSNKFYFQEF